MEKLTQSDLDQFTCTEKYYAYNLFDNEVSLTDGVKFLAEKCACYWLLDAILSWQIYPRMKAEEFQVWKLKRQIDDSWLLTAEDGNGKKLASQDIPYSDFPLNEVSIWLVGWVMLLPSEY